MKSKAFVMLVLQSLSRLHKIARHFHNVTQYADTHLYLCVILQVPRKWLGVESITSFRMNI